jgi:thiol-disulfide isomerase/thioredoxin
MGKTKILLHGFFLLAFGYVNAQVELKKSKVTIAGKIENGKNQTLRITNFELVGRKQYMIKINDDGSFRTALYVLSPHDSYISYNKNNVSVFLEPNDSLYFTADGENFEQTIQFSGDNASSNDALQKFFNEFESLIHSEHLFSIMSNPDPIEFKESVSDFFEKLDAKIEIIGREYQPNYKIIKWMEAYSKYRLGEELFEYGRKSKETLPENFYDFVEEYSISQQKSDLYCSQYYDDFVSEYCTHQFSNYNEWELFKAHSRAGRSYSSIKTLLNIVSEQKSVDSAMELFLTKAYYNALGHIDTRSADTLFAEYSKIVANKSFGDFIKKEIVESRFSENEYTLDDLAQLEFVGEIFMDIKEKHQGKVLYIDFWGTWCKPCLREFPYSRSLHEELSNKDLAFIYLCCSSEKESWQKTIQKFDLAGTHYLLNDDQYNVLVTEFISTGFPQYMIINKEGSIVNRDADRPSSNSTKSKLISLIEE